MESPKPLTPAQQRVVNREHEQWLALPITEYLIKYLEQSAKLRPPMFSSADDIAVFHATAVSQAAYQQVADFIQIPPYPNVDSDTVQNVFDFDYEDEQ